LRGRLSRLPKAVGAGLDLDQQEDDVILERTLRTGIDILDTATGGLARGELAILGGRPSTGKTTLALTIAAHVAGSRGAGVAWFSLELPSSHVAVRLMALDSAIPVGNLLAGRLDAGAAARLEAATAEIGRWPGFFIDDTAERSGESIASAVHALAARTDLALVVIDYLQLVRSQAAHETRSDELVDVCAQLRTLARAGDLAVLVTSQLSRTLEERADRRPRLTDLGRGAVAENADVVLLLDGSEEGSPRLHVAKHPRIAPVEVGRVGW